MSIMYKTQKSLLKRRAPILAWSIMYEDEHAAETELPWEIIVHSTAISSLCILTTTNCSFLN